MARHEAFGALKTVDYDRLAASAPLDRKAAVARDGQGVSFEAIRPMPQGYVHSELPLPIRAFRPTELISPGFRDLTGLRHGRFTALGPSSDHRKRWVVRCDCGRYEIRQAQAMHGGEASAGQAMCWRCQSLELLKTEAASIAAGHGKPTEWAQARRRIRAEAVTAVLAAALTLDAGAGRHAGDISASSDHLAALRQACAAYRALKGA